MQVADAGKPQGWIGVDRGQNILAVASVPSGMPKLWKFAHIRKIRKHYAVKRRRLQKVKKMQVIKRLEQKERQTIKHINHIISKEIVQLAVDFKCGIRLEDLSNIRQTAKQKKKQKSDASSNRNFWSYFQLEQFIFFKAQIAGVAVEKIPAPYRQNLVPSVVQLMSETSTIILAVDANIEDTLTTELVEILATGLVCPARLSFRNLWL